MRLRILLEPLEGATDDQILAMAKATEAAGFDAFFRSDHYLGVDATNPSYRPTDSWTTLAGLARETARVRLGTLMTASTFRHPGPLAISVATVDQMSGGRVELGVGAGWYEREHESFAIPFPPTGERFDRLEEQLEIITGLWRTPAGGTFSFEGAHWSSRDCTTFPRVVQRPHPPIVIGGSGPRRTPSLAARFADEFNVTFGPGQAEGITNFHRICDEVGRDPASVRLSTLAPVPCGAAPAEARRRADRLGEGVARLLSAGVVGVPAQVLEHLGRLAEAGIDTAYFHVYDAEDLEQIALLGAEVLAGI